MNKPGYVYIMASQRNGTIYLGVTSDLVQRVHQHREGLIAGFSRKYGCKLLVWYQAYDDLGSVDIYRSQRTMAATVTTAR
jgi:putative endonuclease